MRLLITYIHSPLVSFYWNPLLAYSMSEPSLLARIINISILSFLLFLLIINYKPFQVLDWNILQKSLAESSLNYYFHNFDHLVYKKHYFSIDYYHFHIFIKYFGKMFRIIVAFRTTFVSGSMLLIGYPKHSTSTSPLPKMSRSLFCARLLSFRSSPIYF